MAAAGKLLAAGTACGAPDEVVDGFKKYFLIYRGERRNSLDPSCQLQVKLAVLFL